MCIERRNDIPVNMQAYDRLQHQLRLNADAIANSIVLEQGKTYADAQGDLLRGLQVVETATGIPTALLGSNIEG